VSNSDDYLFSGGRPNPAMAGIPLRFASSGSEPDARLIEEASRVLGRPVKYVDADGWEHEIIAATAFNSASEIAYVSCTSKEQDNLVSVSFEFRVRDADGREVSSEIESYNPYFGCDVHFMEWREGWAVLVYREKHDTYAAACTSEGPARYVKIADYWIINGDVLGYWRYKDADVRRLRLPDLAERSSVSESEAKSLGVCPSKHW
jgi:hypothetical protein